ncbi:unnamed protein product [Dovyalis caffra]|uniref:U1-type domain-containing protein n=1 Tax=Dovyalis caffra TaxID=77055 RepID=A0AAV1SI34_9ROSI|nr:unnamed protein product [Dovyalis caffra]
MLLTSATFWKILNPNSRVGRAERAQRRRMEETYHYVYGKGSLKFEEMGLDQRRDPCNLEGITMMTMSVELAIQRELAYRAKLAKMLQPHDATVLQDLIPLEVRLVIKIVEIHPDLRNTQPLFMSTNQENLQLLDARSMKSGFSQVSKRRGFPPNIDIFKVGFCGNVFIVSIMRCRLKKAVLLVSEVELADCKLQGKKPASYVNSIHFEDRYVVAASSLLIMCLLLDVLRDKYLLRGQTSTGSSNSSPTLSEITWQAPTNDLKFNLPPPQLHEIENQTESSSFKVQTTSPSPSPRPYSSPSPVISGTGRLPSANSIKFSPPLQLHENDNQIDYTFCKVQSSSSNPNQMETSSWSPLLSGLKRPNSTSSLKFQSPPQHHEPGNQIDCSFCKICQVPCTSFFNYKQHIRGRKHQGKQQELKLKEQLEDKKSMDEQAESKFAKKVGIDSEMAKPKYWCKLCNIWCIDNDALTRHNEGKKHILKLHEIEKKRATLAGLATNRT